MKATTVAGGSSDDPAAEETEAPAPGPDTGTRSAAPAKTPQPASTASTEPEAEAEPDHQAAPEARPEAPAGTETEAEPDIEAEAEARPDAEAELEAEPETDVKTVPEVQPGAPARVEAEASAEAGHGEAEVAADPQAEVEAEHDAEVEAEDDAEADPDVVAGTEVPAEAEAKAEAEAEPEAEATHEVPPEGATDGSGDGDTPDAAAENDTTRHVPSWARATEPDAERTSQFVALKPLDTPAPAAAPVSAPAPGPRVAVTPPPAQAPTPAPLELLAELTNTAPAPETPRRTALRRVKIWTPILLLLVGGFTGVQLLRPLPAPKLVAAETGHTIDGQFSIPWPAKGQGAVRIPGSGEIGTFGEQKPVPTASVAKVMTAYVILKNHPLKKTEPGPSIEVDAKTVEDGTSEHESRIEGLTAGTKFSQQDMLKMLMIPSGNNVARLLARWDTGTDSETAFVEKMNAAARELGMKDTTYTDPSGLDAGTVSTATDQLKLAEAAMKDEAFRAIVALPDATVKGLPQQLINNNNLLTAQGLSIRGIKTGSSTPAGGALMWAAYKSVGDETPLILGTLMEQRVDGPDPDAVKSLALVKANSKKIIEAVRAALASAPVVRKGDTVGYVDDGLGGRTPLVATKDLDVIGVPGQQLKLTLAARSSTLPHTAEVGSEVGVLTAGDGAGAKSVPVAVGSDLAEPSFTTRLTRLGPFRN